MPPPTRFRFTSIAWRFLVVASLFAVAAVALFHGGAQSEVAQPVKMVRDVHASSIRDSTDLLPRSAQVAPPWIVEGEEEDRSSAVEGKGDQLLGEIPWEPRHRDLSADLRSHANREVVLRPAGGGSALNGPDFLSVKTPWQPQINDGVLSPAAPPVSGIKADYYSGTNFQTLLLTRYETQVNYDWGAGSPGGGVAVDNFSVRWSFQLKAPSTAVHTFYADMDDGVRLRVHRNLSISHWSTSAGVEVGTAALTANQYATVELEFYEGTGNAKAILSWRNPTMTKTIIPTSAYFRPATTNASPVAQNDTFSVVKKGTALFSVFTNDTDADSNLDASSINIVSQPSHGTVSLTSFGSVSYTHTGAITDSSDTFSYTIADSATARSNTATVNVTLLPRYLTWQSAHFTAAELANASISGWTEDPDRDGSNNLMEYSMGTDPRSSSSCPIPTVTTVSTDQGSAIQVSYTRPLATDTTLSFQTSTNLGSWHTPGTELEITEDNIFRLTARFYNLPNGPRFMRLRAALIP